MSPKLYSSLKCLTDISCGPVPKSSAKSPLGDSSHRLWQNTACWRCLCVRTSSPTMNDDCAATGGPISWDPVERARGGRLEEKVCIKRWGKRETGALRSWGAAVECCSSENFCTCSSSHWLTLQHSSCLEDKTHTRLCFCWWFTVRGVVSPHQHTQKQKLESHTHTHASYLGSTLVWLCVKARFLKLHPYLGACGVAWRNEVVAHSLCLTLLPRRSLWKTHLQRHTCLRPHTLAQARKTLVAFPSSDSVPARLAPALTPIFSCDCSYIRTRCETCWFPPCVVTVIAVTVRETWGIPGVHLIITIIRSIALLMELCHYIPSCPHYFSSFAHVLTPVSSPVVTICVSLVLLGWQRHGGPSFTPTFTFTFCLQFYLMSFVPSCDLAYSLYLNGNQVSQLSRDERALLIAKPVLSCCSVR